VLHYPAIKLHNTRPKTERARGARMLKSVSVHQLRVKSALFSC